MVDTKEIYSSLVINRSNSNHFVFIQTYFEIDLERLWATKAVAHAAAYERLIHTSKNLSKLRLTKYVDLSDLYFFNRVLLCVSFKDPRQYFHFISF